MTPAAISSSAVVLFNKSLSRSLADAAEQEGWATLAVRNRGDTMRMALTLRPASVMMQIRNRSELPVSVGLLETLRDRCRKMRLLAWSVDHDPDIEQSVRRAGVHAYTSGTSGLLQLRELLSLNQKVPAPYRAHSPSARARPPNRAEHDTVENTRK